MKPRMITLSLAIGFIAAAVCLASYPQASTSAQMGTWKLNSAKSKFAPGSTKNTTVMYEAAGDDIKVTVSGIDVSGNPTHNEWTGKFDGKDYAVTGDPTSDMRSYKILNDHTLELIGKKDGKVTMTGKISVSNDGKTRTVTTNATDAKGKRIKNVAVYDKA